MTITKYKCDQCVKTVEADGLNSPPPKSWITFVILIQNLPTVMKHVCSKACGEKAVVKSFAEMMERLARGKTTR